MKLTPRQIIGLVAIVVFGGVFVWQLTQPNDPFSVPSAVTSDGSSVTLPVIPSPNVPGYLLALGSEDARDDLYCSGLLYAAYGARGDSFSPEAQTQREQVVALAQSGVDKLVAEGVADRTRTAAIADAHSAEAAKDLAAGLPRMTIDACRARAILLPPS